MTLVLGLLGVCARDRGLGLDYAQLDKSDLSVPLTVQHYSEVIEQEVRSVAQQVLPDTSLPSNPPQAPEPRGEPADVQESVSKHDFRSWKVRKEASCKPRREYQPSEVPFSSDTQYKLDFKAWPIPRKENYPWLKAGQEQRPMPSSASAHTLHPSGSTADKQQRGAKLQNHAREPVHRHTTEEQIRPAVKTTSYRSSQGKFRHLSQLVLKVYEEFSSAIPIRDKSSSHPFDNPSPLPFPTKLDPKSRTDKLDKAQSIENAMEHSTDRLQLIVLLTAPDSRAKKSDSLCKMPYSLPCRDNEGVPEKVNPDKYFQLNYV
eukprot:g47585.t1